MPSFNQWTGLGYLTRDPELRYIPSGSPVATFSVACNHKWKTQAGATKETVHFQECVVWNSVAEFCSKFSHKGTLVLVTGRLVTEEWQDKTTQQRRTRCVCQVQTFQVCDKQPKQAEAPSPAAGASTTAATEPAHETEATPPVQDDIPF